MKSNHNLKRVPWHQSGESPDYRFSLANERTFLAWIRTALAFLLAAIALEQLLPSASYGGGKWLLIAILGGFSAFLSVYAYFRWRENEVAMRNQKALGYSRVLGVLALTMLVLTLIVSAICWALYG